MDALIKDILNLQQETNSIKTNIEGINKKLEELGESYFTLGLSLIKHMPPAARAQKAVGKCLQKSFTIQKDPIKEINIEEIREEYSNAKKTYEDSLIKLEKMKGQNEDKLQKRIDLQQLRVNKFKENVEGVILEYTKELNDIKKEYEKYIHNSIIIMSEIQKNSFKVCSGSLQNFQLEWKTGKRYI